MSTYSLNPSLFPCFLLFASCFYLISVFFLFYLNNTNVLEDAQTRSPSESSDGAVTTKLRHNNKGQWSTWLDGINDTEVGVSATNT
jgi:hypothetical protein